MVFTVIVIFVLIDRHGESLKTLVGSNPLKQMEQTNYRSFKLSNVCTEIESVITTLKQVQSQMDLKNYTKLHETIQKLQEHKQYIWQIYKDMDVSE